MRRTGLIAGLALTLMLGVVGSGHAGAMALGDFDIEPERGREGETVDITASDEAPGCSGNLRAAGFRINGTVIFTVVVTLWSDESKTTPLDQETDTTMAGEAWEVVLTMPSLQPAGNYPITAQCQQGNVVEGEYDDQIFVLEAAPGSDRAEPVEAEVTFTG